MTGGTGIAAGAPAGATAAPAGSVTGRPDRADGFVGAAAVVASIALVWLGAGLTFFADEWAVIESRPIGLDSFFRPFNEHWLGVTTLVHRAMVETVGLTSYVPFHALLVGLHVVVALEVYVIARRATRPEVAAAVAIVVLVFGSGFENLFWAMQIGFVGAVALGLGAFLVLDREPSARSTAVGGLLLLVGVATSGYGLFTLAFVGLDVLLDRRRWRALAAAVVPGLVYLGWYVALGRSGVATLTDPFTAAAITKVPGFVLDGSGMALGSATGVGPALGQVLVLVVVLASVWQVARGRRVPARLLACGGAIAFEYALLGLTRGQLPVNAALYTRYAYVSGIVALIGLATLVGWRAMPAAPGRRLAVVAVGGMAFALALTWNVRLLVEGRELFLARADMTRALVTVGLARPLPPETDPDRSLVLVPSPASLEAIAARFGWPVGDSIVPWAVRPVPPDVMAEARRRLIEGAPIFGLDDGP